MRVCLITAKYPPDVGGLAISTRRLAQGLASSSHSVSTFWLDSTIAPGCVSHTRDGDVDLVRVGAAQRSDDSQAALFDRIVALAGERHWDIIHGIYLTSPGFVAVMAGRYLGIPSVVSARGNDLDRSLFDPVRFAQTVWALDHAGAVTANTSDLARRARTAAPRCEPRLVANGVDTSLFAPTPPDEVLRAQHAQGGTPLIAFFGEARLKKGLPVLLNAFGALCRERAAAPPQLLLVGGVRESDAALIRVFRAQHPYAELRVLPHVDHNQLPAWYALADIVVLPSLHDGLPNALLEAMACARPIVASAVGGMLDVLSDGARGCLVPPGDPTALMRALSQLLDDRARAERLGIAARRYVLRELGPERELAGNLAIYRELTARSEP